MASYATVAVVVALSIVCRSLFFQWSYTEN